ncbi:hypothetical protein [Burkholderia sp. BCC1977]|uniref:hypothetical protein n=1 Tax=Burkholderia sp. BCC1977 TaxID=2817440 RepID=UPI002ABDE385|nr:hypothetical protein [Burkholderia sp. BCC1977]
MVIEAGQPTVSKTMPPPGRSLIGMLIVAPLTVGIAGCDKQIDTLPITAAVGYRQGHRVSLNPQQRAVLAQWIDAHRNGWHGLMETPPFPSIGISVDYTEGRYGSFEIWQDTGNGGGVVYRYLHDHTPGAKPVPPLKRRVSEPDVQAFRAIVDNPAN